ncbi:MAG: glycosyltransferase family 4 protein, partial [Pseudomonadota bacterium]
SAATAKLLQESYEVPTERTTVSEPGTKRASRAVRGEGTIKLLAVGAVIPRKDYVGLIEALGQLEHSDWQLTIVGATDHDGGYAQQVREAIMGSGLRRQIELAGEVSADDLDRHYSGTDVFVMPSRYEGYGMVLTEALAHGLPIVCTNAGAMAETVSDMAALKVPPGDPTAFAQALDQLLCDPIERSKRADAAWAAGQALPTWEGCAGIVADVVKSLGGAK